MQEYNSLTAVKVALKVNKSSLEKLVNQQLDQIISNLPPQQFDFGQANVNKTGTLHLDLQGQTIELSIPLDVVFQGKNLFSLFKANAAIELFLETALTFQENWKIYTITKLVRYRWITKPDIQLSTFNLSVEKIADQLLSRFKDKLERQTDEEIQKGWAAASAVQRAKEFFQKAHQLNSAFPIYLHLQPERFQLSPVRKEGAFLQTKIDTIIEIDLNDSAEKNPDIVVPTPSFEESNSEDQQSYFNVNVVLKYPVLEQLLKTQLVGQSFTYKDYEIQFSGVQLAKVNEGIQLIVGVKGYMKGNVRLICLPNYDEATNLVSMQIIDFDLNVDSFWKRNLAGLFSGLIKQEMQKRLRYKLDDALQLEEVKKLEEFSPQEGVIANINMSSLGLRQFIVGEEAMSCVLVVATSIALTLLDQPNTELT